MKSDESLKLAIITESLRRDNHAPLRFFSKLTVTHFFWRAPYGDMTKEEFAGSEKFAGPLDLYRKLLRLKPDIIQGSEPYASKKSLLLALVTLLAARRLRVPFFFPTLENLPPRRRFGGIIGPLVEWVFSVYAGRAKYIIALNNGAAANLRAAGIPDSKIVRFPWGVWGVDRTLFFRRKALPASFFRQPTILFVGRLDPEKGIRDLLQAFAIVAPDHPEWQLAFIGRGTIEDDIAIFAKANHLSERIHRLDWLPSRDLPAFYSAARVTIYPSVATKRGEQAGIQGWSEQIGTVILQSLACGTPVVGTRSGSIPEYLPESAGFLVPERDPEMLAAVIAKVMSDDMLHIRLAAAGIEHIANHFDAKKNIEKGEKMILQWLKKPTDDYGLKTTAYDRL